MTTDPITRLNAALVPVPPFLAHDLATGHLALLAPSWAQFPFPLAARDYERSYRRSTEASHPRLSEPSVPKNRRISWLRVFVEHVVISAGVLIARTIP